jgi:hypothetical protein
MSRGPGWVERKILASLAGRVLQSRSELLRHTYGHCDGNPLSRSQHAVFRRALSTLCKKGLIVRRVMKLERQHERFMLPSTLEDLQRADRYLEIYGRERFADDDPELHSFYFRAFLWVRDLDE